MPEIKLQHVVSVTSEDKNFPADNLLKSESFNKWKSKNVGEKQVCVTLQFEKASQIYQIDIGNDGSAFIEVLVGRSAMRDDEYQVVLVASSFMNPMESRSGQNLNRVRIFGADKLSKVTLDDKWDRVKVVCTQPFHKTSQYGLAFIKFHSPPSESDKLVETSKKTFGAFSVRADTDDNSIQQGSLFAKRKDTVQTTPLTGAAAVRAASKLAEESQRERGPSHNAGVVRERGPSHNAGVVRERGPSHNVGLVRERGPSHNVGLVSQHGDHARGPVVERSDSRRNSSKQQTKRRHSHGDERTGNGVEKQRHSHTSGPSAARGSTYDTPPPSKKARGDTPVARKKPTKTVPLKEVMGRVVFVLSGFQNPQRGQLRDKALQMGARYEGEWTRKCTHLICAFNNTPKYSQVSGKGRIVTKNWVLDCWTEKELLPWRQYRLGNAPSPPGSSGEEEEEDEGEREVEELGEAPNRSSIQDETKHPPKKQHDDSGSDSWSPDAANDSGEDTEEEILRLQEAEEKGKDPEKEGKDPDNDPYEASTDDDNDPSKDDDDESSGGELPELPDFFTDKHFFFYGALTPVERRTLLRYITAYNGTVEDYMTDKVNFVLTNSKWDDTFDEALSDNPNVTFVRPDWIETCHSSQRVVPHQKYIIVPQRLQ